MKKNISFVALSLLVLSIPSQSYALSCMDPEGMVENYVTDPSYTIVTATTRETKEYIKEAAIADDPNAQYNSGYTGQFIEVKEAHKGVSPDSQWVYFHRDGTWNYLCVAQPPKAGTESLYIITTGNGLFDVARVAGVYEADSQIAKDVLKALEGGEEEPSVYEVSDADWVQRLTDELKDMAFIVRVKLEEWKFWVAK